ncbi:hypothetical protein AMTRI_Chr06g194110 [Amborella trichopoda]
MSYLVSVPEDAVTPTEVALNKLHFKGGRLMLRKWEEYLEAVNRTKLWLAVEGIPIHLWTQQVFRAIGECCGSFITLHWKSLGTLSLGFVIILVESSS